MSDLQDLEEIEFKNHENKNKISSPPNEFIMNSKYENSLESSFKKLNSDSTSVISSSSDNDSTSEIDSFRSNYRLKMGKTLRKELKKGQRSRSLFNKKKNYLIDVVNEDATENDIEEKETNMSLNKKHYSNFKIFNNLINNNYNTLDSIKFSNRMSTEKIFKPTEMEPVFEVKEEVEKPENNKNISSTRIKLIKDSKEETYSNTSTQQLYSTANIYDQIVETIAEDNNENFVENEVRSSKSHKKIENFTDKLEDIDEINNDICIDTQNIEAIKEENNEDDEYNLDKLNNSGYLAFADESEKLNIPKNLLRIVSTVLDEEDKIIENINDDKNENEENYENEFSQEEN